MGQQPGFASSLAWPMAPPSLPTECIFLHLGITELMDLTRHGGAQTATSTRGLEW